MSSGILDDDHHIICFPVQAVLLKAREHTELPPVKNAQPPQSADPRRNRKNDKAASAESRFPERRETVRVRYAHHRIDRTAVPDDRTGRSGHCDAVSPRVVFCARRVSGGCDRHHHGRGGFLRYRDIVARKLVNRYGGLHSQGSRAGTWFFFQGTWTGRFMREDAFRWRSAGLRCSRRDKHALRERYGDDPEFSARTMTDGTFVCNVTARSDT